MAATTTIPKGFTDLSSAYHLASEGKGLKFGCIIGVVVDSMQPSVNHKSGQHQCFFKLNDPSLINSLQGSQGLSIKFFQQDFANIPKISGDGDIVLLRQIKLSNYQGQPVGLSNYQTQVAVFPADLIPQPAFNIGYAAKDKLTCHARPDVEKSITQAEQMYVIELKAAMEPLLQQQQERMSAVPRQPRVMYNPTPAQLPMRPPVSIPAKRSGPDLGHASSKLARTSTFGPKFKLVEDLQHRVFADLCVQVAKKFTNQYGACELYVTDYTSNPQGWYYPPPEEHSDGERDGDEFGYHPSRRKAFPGPYEHRCFKINVKPPHCYYVNANVAEGQFVLLQNVKCKFMPDGAKLEGDMWEDSMNPEKIQVRILTNLDIPEVNALKQRKKEYWQSRQSKTKQEGPQELTKAQRKKNKKKNKQHLAHLERMAARPDQKQPDTTKEPQAIPNQHVRCSHDDVPLSSLADILDQNNTRHTNTKDVTYTLPFINAKYRTKARVIDFHPNNLQDFAVLADPKNEERSEFSQHVTWDSFPKWEWSFSLLIEDGALRPQHNTTLNNTTANNNAADKDTLWLHVAHQDAQYLLGNAVGDPADLREDRQLLAQLREKLYILWGNLEEIKARQQTQEKLSNRPFECCVMEYGQPIDDGDDPVGAAGEPGAEDENLGFVRLYRLFGATIS